MKRIKLLFLFVIFSVYVVAQEKKADDFEKKYLNWHQKEPQKDKVMGTSVDKLYNELLNEIKPEKTIVVAVIDGGVDIFHEDLKGQIWINEKEVAENGIDDDANGFIDDVYGWNYIGNSKGENIVDENCIIQTVSAAGSILQIEPQH